MQWIQRDGDYYLARTNAAGYRVFIHCRRGDFVSPKSTTEATEFSDTFVAPISNTSQVVDKLFLMLFVYLLGCCDDCGS